jgi:16S rRNA U516 pseudouridylate synthase RsuA-like enzyme
MAKRSGFHVVSLHRIRIASILHIDSVPIPGQCRWLTDQEIAQLYEGLLLNS